MQPNGSNQLQKIFAAILRFSLLFISFFTSESIYAQQIHVERVSYAGQGCASGTLALVMAPDNSSFSMLFTDFGVESNAPMSKVQKTCRVEIDMTIPKGFQLELPYVDYRGYAFAADAHSTAILKSNHYFSGGTVDMGGGRRVPGGTFAGGITESMQGPLDDAFLFRSEVPELRRNRVMERGADRRTEDRSRGRGRWIGRERRNLERNISRCNGVAKLRVDTRVMASVAKTRQGHALLQLDSADGSFMQNFGLALLPCDNENKKAAEICRRSGCPEKL